MTMRIHKDQPYLVDSVKNILVTRIADDVRSKCSTCSEKNRERMQSFTPTHRVAMLKPTAIYRHLKLSQET